MKRSKMIEQLVRIFESIPTGASSYHIIDTLLYSAEKRGMVLYRIYECGCCKNLDWDEEDETL